MRDRYDGEKRNSWNEIECGNNYARSMASFALMLHYSGFSFDMTKGYIGFDPINHGQYLWSIGATWGNVTVNDSGCTLEVLGEPLILSYIGVPNAQNVDTVKCDGKRIHFAADDNALAIDCRVESKLEILYKL